MVSLHPIRCHRSGPLVLMDKGGAGTLAMWALGFNCLVAREERLGALNIRGRDPAKWEGTILPEHGICVVGWSNLAYFNVIILFFSGIKKHNKLVLCENQR